MPPGWSGAGRPEKRVTARSKLPQNRWTGLTFPTYVVRNRFSTRVDRDDRLEKTRYRVGVVGPRLPIISKRNWIGNFIRATVELRRAAKLPDQVQEARVKLGNGHRAKRESRSASIGCCANGCIVDKIECNLHAHRAIWDFSPRCVDV
jgi:hypothetical protein